VDFGGFYGKHSLFINLIFFYFSSVGSITSGRGLTCILHSSSLQKAHFKFTKGTKILFLGCRNFFVLCLEEPVAPSSRVFSFFSGLAFYNI